MDWFERLTGFPEGSYVETQRRLRASEGRLHSEATGRQYEMGRFEMPSLAELRTRVRTSAAGKKGCAVLSHVRGDVRALHRHPDNEGAVFQVASQFNCLEMLGPSMTPEHGVTGYEHDATQGPACALAAGAATIYRNYLVPVGSSIGQTATRQLDGLHDLRQSLARRLRVPADALWRMRNGYVLPEEAALVAIGNYLRAADAATLDEFRGMLRIGIQWDVEVTDGPVPGPLVTQVFCSALPIAYSHTAQAIWEPLAVLVLEAAYEATLLTGAMNASRGRSNRVLFTRLGGGAFGNADCWIDDALMRACSGSKAALEIVTVKFG